MKTKRLFPTLLFVLSTHFAHGADLGGRVTDDGDGVGIEGALLELDQTPPDGSAEHTIRADFFGFYELKNIPSGAYEVRASHPAYVGQTVTNTLTNGVFSERHFVLSPLTNSFEFFDISGDVRGVMSGLPLENIAVQALRYSGPGDAIPSQLETVMTDEDGAFTVFGARVGYYDFIINDPGLGHHNACWEPYTASNRVLIEMKSQVTSRLVPRKRDFEVMVQGFDP
ncbi:MAG: carboxypeptidase regulatory-like domain-containing protein, partial [Verrucomicrobiota bacterium]